MRDYNNNDEFISRSQRKRDSSKLQKLGEDLIKLPKNKRKEFKLSEDLSAALSEYSNLKTHEARRRHLQYIGKLMRYEENIVEIEELLAQMRD